MPLGPLSPADAAEVLRRAGLDEDQAAWVNRFVRGHPLSLQLAASAIRERPDAPEDAVLPTVVQELAALYLDGLDPATREALDATSVLRRVTLSLLGALLPDEPPQAPFERLRRAAVRRARARGPGRPRHRAGGGRRAAARERPGAPPRLPRRRLAADPGASSRPRPGAARWASLADMIALVDEPLVREAFFPSSVQHYAVETARPDDRDAIVAIVARHEPAEQSTLVRAWWDEVPDAFRVARNPRGQVVAFTILCELADVPQRLLVRDPLCEPWRRHLRVAPGPARPAGPARPRSRSRTAPAQAPSPCFAALLRDMERASLEAGPALRRIYSHARGDALARPARAARLRRRSPTVPTSSSAAWRTGRSSATSAPSRSPAGCRRSPPATCPSRPPPSTRTRASSSSTAAASRSPSSSATSLRYLREREDQPVARETLLRDVWGYEWTGGSNVVDVAVSGLRRKLGDRAARAGDGARRRLSPAAALTRQSPAITRSSARRRVRVGDQLDRR